MTKRRPAAAVGSLDRNLQVRSLHLKQAVTKGKTRLGSGHGKRCKWSQSDSNSDADDERVAETVKEGLCW
ncbi:hypothetical protein L1987_88064 [Smallanthus sonchifolius]|nr:hypothetical protein L1987_88064 [Smallanthus sonchifolius]